MLSCSLSGLTTVETEQVVDWYDTATFEGALARLIHGCSGLQWSTHRR